MTYSQEQAKKDAHAVILQGNIGMRCLITRNAFSGFGFRFDPAMKHAVGDFLRDGPDGMTEVVDVILEREECH